MTYFIIRVVLHVVCFMVSFYALQALDFNRFLKQGHVTQAQLLMLILAMGLGYLMAQFLISLTNTIYFY